MKTTIDIDPKGKLLVVTIDGPVDFNRVRDVFFECLKQSFFSKNMNSIVDIRNTSFEVKPNDIGRLIDLFEAYKTQRGSGFKMAILATQDFAFGLARVFSARTLHIPIDVGVFRRESDAMDWLSLSPKGLQGAL